jgi:hypothetical protein
MGSRAGAIKSHAARLGISSDEYQAKLQNGEKWCTRCKAWHPRESFGRDSSRADGLATDCLSSRHTGNPRGWPLTGRINPETGRSGPSPLAPRDGDKRQARRKVNLEVRMGRWPHPGMVACTDCGHLGDGPRHEYDHYLGYQGEHHLHVQVVCAPCHHVREIGRAAGK